MKLAESDIKEIQKSNEQITLILNDSKNPSTGGDTTFNHVSNDFVTKKDVEDAVRLDIVKFEEVPKKIIQNQEKQ